MSAVNKQYKKPSQIRGERSLRDRNLLVSPRALNNIEVVKRKARAIRLKEEYQRNYLTKGRSTSTRRATGRIHCTCTARGAYNQHNILYHQKNFVVLYYALDSFSVSYSLLYFSWVLSPFHLLLD
jgi:hypothetical protein